MSQRYGGWDVHCETTGGEETGGTGEYGHVEVDGCPRGTADGMFTVRQLVEKRLEGQENMDMLGWMGVPEVEVRMVEGTYEETKGRVVCGLEYWSSSG